MAGAPPSVCAAISFAWVIAWYFTSGAPDHPGMTRRNVICRRPSERPAGALGGCSAHGAVTIVYFCYGWTLWLFLSWILSSCTRSNRQMAVFSSMSFWLA
jgi:hypothetical protein